MSLFESAMRMELNERRAQAKADGVPFTATLFESALLQTFDEANAEREETHDQK